MEKSELSVHDIKRKTSIRHEVETPQAEADETFQHTTIIFQREPDPFFHPVLYMVSWVISTPGERWVEGNNASCENFSLNRGVTNLEKTFHIEGGEDFLYTLSGQVQTHEIKPSGSEVVLMDCFYRPRRSG